jgi:glycosyltransferase involved in cell wall biosynthesis
MPARLKGVSVRSSWMRYLPFVRHLHRLYFFVYPFAVESLDMREFDLVLSSSWGYVKGLKTRRDAIHVCYCHNPMRWVWEYEGYVARERLNPVFRTLLPAFIWALRKWDIATAKRPDYFITNSHYSAARILSSYGRVCEVIYPPVDVERFSPSDEIGDYYLVLARLVSYRRIDTAVVACTKLNRQLRVIGEGPDLKRLARLAGPNVHFLGHVSDAEVNRQLSQCRALIFPGIEDFGIVAVEAAAAGRPVIAVRAGGATETVVDGETGVFYEPQDAEALAGAIVRLEERTWDSDKIREHASKFRPEVFCERLMRFLDRAGISATGEPG